MREQVVVIWLKSKTLEINNIVKAFTCKLYGYRDHISLNVVSKLVLLRSVGFNFPYIIVFVI